MSKLWTVKRKVATQERTERGGLGVDRRGMEALTVVGSVDRERRERKHPERRLRS